MTKSDSSQNPHKNNYLKNILGASINPFDMASNGAGLYQNDHLVETQSLICHLLEKSNKLILIEACKDSGKSTFFKKTVTQISIQHKMISFKAEPKTSPEQLLKKIAQGLGLAYKMGKDIRLRIFHSITELVQNNTKPMMLIDESHLLNEDCLELLANFNHETSTPLSIALFSETSIHNKLTNLKTKIEFGMNAHQLFLRAYTLKQTAEFISLHLDNIGIQIPFILTDVQIASIHKDSSGLPGEIKSLTQELLGSKKVVNHIKTLLKQEKSHSRRHKKK